MLTEKPKPNDRALRIRRMTKSKKPDFVRYESWRYVRLGKPWRKQIGLDNKNRLKLKGWEVSPRIGFRGPRDARDLHPSGYKEVMVYNLENLDKVDPKIYAIRVSHQVGTRKRMLILGKAEELGLKVLNPVAEITLPPSETEVAKEEEVKKIPKGKEQEEKKPTKAELETKQEKTEQEEKKPTKATPKTKKQEKEEEKEQTKETKAPKKKTSKAKGKAKENEPETENGGKDQ